MINDTISYCIFSSRMYCRSSPLFYWIFIVSYLNNFLDLLTYIILIYIKFNRWNLIWWAIQINLLTRSLSYLMKKWSDSTQRYWTAHPRIWRRRWQWSGGCEVWRPSTTGLQHIFRPRAMAARPLFATNEARFMWCSSVPGSVISFKRQEASFF